MATSLFASVEEFFLTGLISLAIVLATIRAYIAKVASYVEMAGFSGFFIFCLVLTLGVYVYISMKRCCFWGGEDEWDEEEGEMMVEEIHTDSRSRFGAILLDWAHEVRPNRFYRWQRGGIRLEDGPVLADGHALLERRHL